MSPIKELIKLKKYQNNKKYNPIRDILQTSQNKIKLLEYSLDNDIQKAAIDIWNQLEKIRIRIGSYPK